MLRSIAFQNNAEKLHSCQHERTVQRNIWEGALAAAKRVEEEFGKENLGPWTDFEWGMINGKLSGIVEMPTRVARGARNLLDLV